VVGDEVGSTDVRFEPLVSWTFQGRMMETPDMVVITVFRRRRDGQVYGREYLRPAESASAGRMRRLLLARSRRL